MTTSSTIDTDDNARKIMRLFETRNVDARVASCTVAPQLTRYGISVSMGTKVSDVLAMRKDIAFLLGHDNIDMRMPTNGEALLTVDVPRVVRAYLARDDVPMSTDAPALTYTLGRSIAGETLTANLAEDVHLLVAGITGSGKSIFLTGLLLDLLARNDATALRLLLIDPKMTAFTPFAHVPHLMSPIITESIDAVDELRAVRATMAEYSRSFAEHGVDDIAEYNALGLNQLPYTVIVVDELADLLASHKKEIAPLLVKLATKGRAAGIILVLATQKPTADLIPTALKSSLPSSVAFRVRSQSDSRVALDQGGAEHLFGSGDGLYLANGAASPTRFQGAYVSKADARELISTVMPVADLRAAPEPVWPTEPVPELVVAANSSVPVYSHITYTVSGVGNAEVISYLDRGESREVKDVPLPWTTTVRVLDPEPYALEARGTGIELFVEHNGQLIDGPATTPNRSAA
jgi:S-DNA-T family DNA segregation ATPase FtsK/SpoIIIE